MIALFSCKAGEHSWEDDKLGHGVFFAHLIGGLKGEAGQEDGTVTLDGLAGYVKHKVAAYGAEHPERLQTTHARYESLGVVVLAVGAPKPSPPTDTKSPSTSPDSPRVVRTIPLNHALAPNDPRIDFTLDRIELLSNHRMRWHFTFWNRRAREVRVGLWEGKNTYVTDEKGNRSDSLTTSTGGSTPHVADGEKSHLWIDFQEPLSGWEKLTARFAAGSDYDNIPMLTVGQDGTVVRYGKLVLKSQEEVKKDVKAWVEVNGRKDQDWPGGTKQLEVIVPSGKGTVTVRSLYQGGKFSTTLAYNVGAEQEVTLDIGGLKYDGPAGQ
jgi:hypothetical protein